MNNALHDNLPSFAGRRALVTGAGGGIGRDLALSLARHGADVCVLDLSADAAEATAAEIRQHGRRAAVLAHDMGSASVVGAIEAAAHEFGTFDLLVNNAGISPKKPDGGKRMIWETPVDEWCQVIQVNLTGYFMAMRAVLPGMVGRRRGSIVNIGSLAGLRYSRIAGAAYATAKQAVAGLTRQAAGEVAEFGIRINCVAPGRIETSMAAVAGDAFNEAIRKETPLRRLGQPLDISNAALFLLSDQAGFITGECLNVTGGRGL
ncbi:SDR family NAD(P)-dependent oxidoreductase [Bordetella genomosp. 13]|uniref:3-ketoacyl-ACP reductase n=1 Tax=Bordetella genomosp. 13 TaxID=463040 RepID=A0A1W6ZFJ9_9BORD|nr:SDR family NAD(P)-dependent oxidoreductase [Bordetella genomosp. 13]ARP96109.1 3-ketoacyl-ACP reductase [Bordetella genomosp. 13]